MLAFNGHGPCEKPVEDPSQKGDPQLHQPNLLRGSSSSGCASEFSKLHVVHAPQGRNAQETNLHNVMHRRQKRSSQKTNMASVGQSVLRTFSIYQTNMPKIGTVGTARSDALLLPERA